jgi:hypothetical protein
MINILFHVLKNIPQILRKIAEIFLSHFLLRFWFGCFIIIIIIIN